MFCECGSNPSGGQKADSAACAGGSGVRSQYLIFIYTVEDKAWLLAATSLLCCGPHSDRLNCNAFSELYLSITLVILSQPSVSLTMFVVLG